jgi:hypothetical protein
MNADARGYLLGGGAAGRLFREECGPGFRRGTVVGAGDGFVLGSFSGGESGGSVGGVGVFPQFGVRRRVRRYFVFFGRKLVAQLPEAVEIFDGAAVEAFRQSLEAKERGGDIGLSGVAIEVEHQPVGAGLVDVDVDAMGDLGTVEDVWVLMASHGRVEAVGEESGLESIETEHGVLREGDPFDGGAFLGVDGLVGGNGVGDEGGDADAVFDADDGERLGVEGRLAGVLEARTLPSVVRDPLDLPALARLAATRLGGGWHGWGSFMRVGGRSGWMGKRLRGKGMFLGNCCEWGGRRAPLYLSDHVATRDRSRINENHGGQAAKRKDPAAVALGRKGGKKGGPARAAKLTPRQRSESARRAVQARWTKAKQGKDSTPASTSTTDTSDSAVLALLKRIKASNNHNEIRQVSDQLARVIFHKRYAGA